LTGTVTALQTISSRTPLPFFKSSKLSLQKGEERETQNEFEDGTAVMNSLIRGVVSYFAFAS